jgi:hypothetical protein
MSACFWKFIILLLWNQNTELFLLFVMHRRVKPNPITTVSVGWTKMTGFPLDAEGKK